MKQHHLFLNLNNQKGVSAVIVAICLVMLVGFIALAIDVGHIYVARNELQNAADAGALAGAHNLYTDDGTALNADANEAAYQAAITNRSDGEPVEVNDHLSNLGDVQRGHWSFKDRKFTPNDSLATVPIWNYTEDELDAMTEFINAVRVRTHRGSPDSPDGKRIPIQSFFAWVFERFGFEGSAQAVAVIQFAGGFNPANIDQPIAICAEALTNDPECFERGDCNTANKLTCNIGRMLNSGVKDETHNTAAWTNFSQPCNTADASEMDCLVCNNYNNDPNCDPPQKQVNYGQGMGATGGVQQSTLTSLRDCWLDGTNYPCGLDGQPYPVDPDDNERAEHAWGLKLPVVRCPGNNVSNCPTVVGVVYVSVLWMTRQGTPDPSIDTPWEMTHHTSDTDIDGVCSENEITDPSPWSVFNQPDLTAQNSLVPPKTWQELEQQEGFPQKHFADNTASCESNPAAFEALIQANAKYAIIPAPIGPSPDALAEATDTLQDIDLQVADPSEIDGYNTDLKDVPYDPSNVCSEELWQHMVNHRKADAAGDARWISFREHFNLRNYDSDFSTIVDAPLAKKSIYYMPGCTAVEPEGDSQGYNFGVLAKIPVLVK